MITLEKLISLIAANHNKDVCFSDCEKAYREGDLTEFGKSVGMLSAKDALQTFGLRKQTSKAAHIETCGFELTLQNLSLCAPSEIIILKALRASNRIFTIFFTEPPVRLIGCICVTKSSK